jgi:hypothetical protein
MIFQRPLSPSRGGVSNEETHSDEADFKPSQDCEAAVAQRAPVATEASESHSGQANTVTCERRKVEGADS